ncbi:class I SAM-dependent methyltransferase [Winogradskyella alexanderae]|uniref:Class I SAM-dependent methyltransferase n=1 Tax=Winogradskyella alexanderae TaxID=2877123 RepID=A0ABS7XNW7_9FLAO|nr:class I SAM-dependent methyltransferase [Winogradskyella alexanderae]MCA0131697.1 class I SAM-dependent methyltransferase [Winogradskyella alexanderae]
MKTRHFLPLASLIVLFCACGETNKKEVETTPEKEPIEKHHKKHQERNRHHSGSANAYMHKKPVEELIKNFESPERDAYQKPEKVLQYLGNISDKTIMDIGAGSGYFSVKLAEKGAKVIAADVSEEFQEALKKRIENNKLENITLRKIPYNNPSLEPNEVDMVLIVNTYHHIENRSDYFAKVKTGTKSTGELVLIDFFKSETPVGPPLDHKISIDQVITELKEAGYSNFDINVDLLPYQYIIKAK